MSSKWYRITAAGFALVVLAGCVTQRPTGPTVSVMPAPGKPIRRVLWKTSSAASMRARWIASESGDTSGNFAGSAVAGTAIGAVAGKLIGGDQGASVGAGMGFLAGSSQGASQAEYSTRSAQWRYDNAYKQCMYAKGNQASRLSIPAAGRSAASELSTSTPAASASG